MSELLVRTTVAVYRGEAIAGTAALMIPRFLFRFPNLGWQTLVWVLQEMRFADGFLHDEIGRRVI